VAGHPRNESKKAPFLKETFNHLKETMKKFFEGSSIEWLQSRNREAWL
jgi:hypothetical protein